MPKCVTILSKGGADVLIARAPQDHIPQDESVIPSQPMSQDGYFIVSLYNCSIDKALEDSTTTDLTHLIHAFPFTVWFVASIAFFSVSLIVSLHRMNHGNKWTVDCF